MRDAINVIRNLKRIGGNLPPDSFYTTRYNRNIEGKKRFSSRRGAWHGLMVAILSTRQASVGRNNRTSDALQLPELQWLEVKDKAANIPKHINSFTDNRKKIRYLQGALEWLNDDEIWKQIKSYQRKIIHVDINDWKARLSIEREAAKFVSEVKGIGCKQSRNFWQYRGYSAWTIPLDSRIQGIISRKPFEIELSVKHHYDEIEDKLVRHCIKAKTYPCMLDASLFNLEGLIRSKVGLPTG